MKQIIAVIFLFSLIPLTSAQLGYNNPNLPRIDAPATTFTTTASGGGNVTSVTSSTNCIIVNPTTGDVVLTFNNSCAGSGGGDFSFTDFQASFNLNLTGVLPLENRTRSHITNITGFIYNYNQTIAINPFNQVLNTTSNVTFDYITTTGNVTSTKWFNGLFNWTTSSFLTFNGAFLDLASTTKQWLYNQTTAVFTMPLLNNTIADYGNRVGFNSTFNSTYATFSYNQTIIQSASGVSPYINTSINANKGLAIQFNETKLNQTIDNRGVAVGFNSTFNSSYDSKISFNNTNIAYLNNTQTFTKTNTFTQTGLGSWVNFDFTGIGTLGQITSALGLFEFHALSNFDFYFTNTARTAIIALLNSGVIQLTATNVNIPATADLNSSNIKLYTNTQITGNLNVSGNTCLSNGRCLNYTAGLKNSLPIYNKTLLYWNNNTLDWQQLTSPVGDVFLGHCDATGLSWRSASASCPI